MRVRRSASDACMQCGLLNVLLCSGRISCKRCTAHASRSCLPHSPLAPRLLPPRLGCRCRHPCQPLVNLAFDDACDAAHLRRPCARVSCRKTQGLPSINGSRRRSMGRAVDQSVAFLHPWLELHPPHSTQCVYFVTRRFAHQRSVLHSVLVMVHAGAQTTVRLVSRIVTASMTTVGGGSTHPRQPHPDSRTTTSPAPSSGKAGRFCRRGAMTTYRPPLVGVFGCLLGGMRTVVYTCKVARYRA